MLLTNNSSPYNANDNNICLSSAGLLHIAPLYNKYCCNFNYSFCYVRMMYTCIYAAPSGSPVALMAEKSSSTLTLSWEPPSIESQNGIIRQYVVYITENETDTTTHHYSNTTQLIISGLHPFYTYKCTVAAETIGVGPFSAILVIQLDEDSELKYSILYLQ